jgi:hypothetical protein
LPAVADRVVLMVEKSIDSRIDNDRKLTDTEVDMTRRGMSFAIALTTLLTTASLTFFALAVAGVGYRPAAITAASVCLGVPAAMLIRSFIARS